MPPSAGMAALLARNKKPNAVLHPPTKGCWQSKSQQGKPCQRYSTYQAAPLRLSHASLPRLQRATPSDTARTCRSRDSHIAHATAFQERVLRRDDVRGRGALSVHVQELGIQGHEAVAPAAGGQPRGGRGVEWHGAAAFLPDG